MHYICRCSTETGIKEEGDWKPFKILDENKVDIPNILRHVSFLTIKVTRINW